MYYMTLGPEGVGPEADTIWTFVTHLLHRCKNVFRFYVCHFLNVFYVFYFADVFILKQYQIPCWCSKFRQVLFGKTDRQTDRHTHTQTCCSSWITRVIGKYELRMTCTPVTCRYGRTDGRSAIRKAAVARRGRIIARLNASSSEVVNSSIGRRLCLKARHPDIGSYGVIGYCQVSDAEVTRMTFSAAHNLQIFRWLIIERCVHYTAVIGWMLAQVHLRTTVSWRHGHTVLGQIL